MSRTPWAPFLVKRYAPMIGRPDSPKRITTAFYAYALDHAIAWAKLSGYGRVWIEARRAPASRRRRR